MCQLFSGSSALCHRYILLAKRAMVGLVCFDGQVQQCFMRYVAEADFAAAAVYEAVYGPHWVCPSSRQCVLPRSTLLRLRGALQGHCPKWALLLVHFPGLSHSGSQVLRKGTDLVGCAFCFIPRSKQLRQPGAWRAYCLRWAVCLNRLPGPSHSVPQVRH